jgi:hypothetical protein
MAKKYPKDLGEWPVLIKAQDETSKSLINQEKEIIKKNKIEYKTELDKQLIAKKLIMKEFYDDKLEELNFLKAQQKAIKTFEKEKRIEDRSYQQIYMLANQDQKTHKDQKSIVLIKEDQEQQQKWLRNAQEIYEKEKYKEFASKSKNINDTKEVLNKQIQEKLRKIELERIEKDNDRIMIEKNIQEMKLKEQSYKNFYDKRMALLEEKSKHLNYFVENDKSRQDLINKRNQEWEQIDSEKFAAKQKIEEEIRRRNIKEVKNELEKQIDLKKQKKIQEWQESVKEQEQARIKAIEDQTLKSVEQKNKVKKIKELKFFLEKQLHEKQQELGEYYMDPIEKKINKKVLESISNKKIIGFPSIPGVYTSEPPIKDIYAKVFPNHYNSKSLISNKSDSESKNSISSSFDSDYKRKKYTLPDPNKHDPIVNPIGSFPPRVLPGQRIVKGMNSNSSLINAANSMFNYN